MIDEIVINRELYKDTERDKEAELTSARDRDR